MPQENPQEIKPVHHRMTRRCIFHDYNKKGTYLITLVVADGCPSLGELQGDPTVPHLQKNCPYVKYNVLGLTIYHECLRGITYHYPMVKIWKVCIMPDHIHLILRVDDVLPNNRHLGHVIAGFKGGCSRAARDLGLTKSEILPNGKRSLVPLFVEGYNDRILWEIRPMFDNWVHYLEDNPRRLLVKHQYPGYFKVVRSFKLDTFDCQMIGNKYLLSHPDKMSVVYHRWYSEKEWADWVAKYKNCGERGGVLVCTGINPREREVMNMAYDNNYRIIRLMDNGFSERYKPYGRDFDYCAEGLLLQVTPFEYHYERRKITRPECEKLNELGKVIAENVVFGEESGLAEPSALEGSRGSGLN